MTEKEILKEIIKVGNVPSQAILAEVSGVKPQQISAYIKGARTPKLETLRQIANSVDVDIEIIIKKAKTPTS